MAPPSTLALEETRPRLVESAQFIPFSTNVTYLKNTANGDFVKLSSHEAALARYFNGKYTFSEILHKHLDTAGTRHLLNIAEILLSLKSHGFIIDETAGKTGPEKSLPRQSGFFDAIKAIKNLISIELHKLKGGFKNRVFQKTAGFFSSTPGLLLLFLASLGLILLSPDFRVPFIDFGNFSGTGFAAKFTIGYYLSYLALLWLSVCLILSVKNLVAAYALSSKGCSVYHPRIRSVCGFVYFDCTLTDIVSAGPLAVIRVFVLRMFLPVLFLQIVSVLGQYVQGDPLVLATVKKACFLVAAFSIIPLTKTDLNNMLYLLTRSTRDFYQCLSYLGKRFFFKTEKFTSQPRGENDFCVIITLLSLVWLAAVGKFMWSAAEEVLFFLSDGFARGGFSLENAYVPLQIFTMLAPFIILVIMAILVGASNVQHVLEGPIHRLAVLSEKIQKAPASELVISFIRQIPLFASLDEEKLTRLSARFSVVKYNAGRKIILQGEKGDSFYIILSGKTRILIADAYGEERIVNVLSTGDCFGEIALIENIPRTATVVAATAVSLLRLGRGDFEEFVAALPIEKKRITDSIRHGKLLMSIPLFNYLSPEQFCYLIDHCKVESFKKDDVIFRKGDTGDRFYIIKEGFVTIGGEENAAPFKTLAKGSVFGEIALVKHLPRTAQATAASELSVLSLGKESFYELIGKSILTGAEFDRLADRRIAEMEKNATDVAV